MIRGWRKIKIYYYHYYCDPLPDAAVCGVDGLVAGDPSHVLLPLALLLPLPLRLLDLHVCVAIAGDVGAGVVSA